MIPDVIWQIIGHYLTAQEKVKLKEQSVNIINRNTNQVINRAASHAITHIINCLYQSDCDEIIMEFMPLDFAHNKLLENHLDHFSKKHVKKLVVKFDINTRSKILDKLFLFTELTELSIDIHLAFPLDNETMISTIASSLSSLTRLRKFALYDCSQFKSRLICEQIAKMKNLTHLTLHFLSISRGTFPILVKEMVKNNFPFENLYELNLHGCSIFYEMWLMRRFVYDNSSKLLLELIIECKNLQSLNLANNQISYATLDEFKSLFPISVLRGSKLTKLHLKLGDFNEVMRREIIDYFSSLPKLEVS